MNVQPLVDILCASHGDLDELFPEGKVFRVAGLQLHGFLQACFSDFRTGFGLLFHQLVETQQFFDRIRGEGTLVKMVFPAVEHLPHRCSPVPDVVVSNHIMSEESCSAS